MKILLPIALICIINIFSFGQQNTQLLGSLKPYATSYSDIWGYADAQGNEYALLGVSTGTSIINVTDPAQPVESAFIPGPSSIWRDIKTHSTYAYVVTEGTSGGFGLQIIDLSQLPSSAALVNTITTWFNRAHNIYIDNGYAYVIGTNNGGGMHILDLSDPVNPTRTAYYSGSGYVHDVYVWDDTVAACAESTYDLVDVTDKSNPVKINSSLALPGIYAHSGWMTDDKQYFIAAEEFNVRDVTVWNLSDKSVWNLSLSQWQMPGSSPVHNIFIKGIYAHISYYKDGYVVLDISDPESPVKVGQYDTYPGTSGTYEGAWGCYPYLPSGNILISDISSGLFVIDFTLDNSTPVELENFNLSISGNDVIISWLTASEINNRGFEIERSIDNKEFFAVGFVDGTGNSTEKNSYNFIDKNIIGNKLYYRIVQYDFDGTKKIYDAAEIDINNLISFELYQNFPNPFNPETTIKFNLPSDLPVKLEIFNSLGEKTAVIFNEFLSAGIHTANFSGKNLSSGIYFAKLQAGENVSLIKMNLLK